VENFEGVEQRQSSQSRDSCRQQLGSNYIIKIHTLNDASLWEILVLYGKIKYMEYSYSLHSWSLKSAGIFCDKPLWKELFKIFQLDSIRQTVPSRAFSHVTPCILSYTPISLWPSSCLLTKPDLSSWFLTRECPIKIFVAKTDL